MISPSWLLKFAYKALTVIFAVMIFKRLFDIVASLLGLLLIWWIFPLVAFLIHKKMPGGSAFFVQKRVGKGGKLFKCHSSARWW